MKNGERKWRAKPWHRYNPDDARITRACRRRVCLARRESTAGMQTLSMRLAAIPVLMACAVVSCLAQQQLPPQPSLKSEADEVVVDVIVSDRQGHHVPGLSAGDFKLSEDGAPQTITTFIPPPARDEGAQPTPSTTAVENAGVRVSAPQQTRAPQLITLVMDVGDMHFENLKEACAAAAKFAERTIGAGNSIALYWVDTSLHLAVPFTQDKRRVLDALEKLGNRVPSGRLTARAGEAAQTDIADLFASITPPEPQAKTARSARLTSEQVMQESMNSEHLQEAEMLMSWLVVAGSFQARAVFVALRALASGYGTLPGRKSVVVFSEGFLHASLAESEMEAVIDAAKRANVAIYVMDTSGINTGRRGDLLNARVQHPDITDGSEALLKMPTLRPAEARRTPGQTTQAMGIDRYEWYQTLGSDLDDDLGVVADSTGGFLVKNTIDLGPGLDRVADDAGEFYTLAYNPSNHNYDGAFRRIKVEVSTRGYHVRHRQGYWAIPPVQPVLMTPAAAQLLAAVESGERKPSFAPQLNAALVADPNGRFGVSAAVSMPSKLVRFEKLQDQYVASVSVLLMARDAQGRLLAVHERYSDLRFQRKPREALPSKILNLQGHVSIPELQPVSVQAIVRFSDGTVGVSERKSLAPAPGSANLGLTSLVLSDEEVDADCSPDPMDPLCVKGVRISLPAQPQFPRSSPLVVYFSLMGLRLDDAQKPALRVSFNLLSGGARNPFKPERSEASLGSLPHTLLVMAVFNLQTLPPGPYTLEMTAADKVQNASATERAEFIVQ